MSKYIDADKLIAKIEWLKGINNIVCGANKNYCRGYADAIEDILNRISSLQQEQPEVDFEKAYKSYMESRKDDLSGNAVTVNVKDMARYFYELAQRTKYQQDREEFAKLKAKEWQEGYNEGYAKGLNTRKEE